ncbi:MAG TPA: penicillin acylase family protein [Candidatus Eisenbacteria bacterium]|nr:penicillin acylase family protein [Candidatus Eisenbacteria bacterium]
MTFRPLVALVVLVSITASPAHALCTANASPQVACTIKKPDKLKVQITRDDYGVPHLKARTLYDVGYGMGQGQAQDRLFQMELVRKSATGNVAELFGRDFLSSDIDARRQFYSDEERQYLATTVSCPVQTLVQGFVDGVNAYIDEIYAGPSLDRIPYEFFILPLAIRLQGNFQIPGGVRYSIVAVPGGGEVYKPDPWRVTDVGAIGVLLAGRFGSGGGRQLRQAALLNYLTAKLGSAAAARDVFEDVRWLDDPNAPTTIPTSGAINKVKGGKTPVPIADAAPVGVPSVLAQVLGFFTPPIALADIPRDPYRAQHAFLRDVPPSTILRGLRATQRMEREARELNRRFGVFLKSGSNAWVVSPERSQTGHALLWGGPQEGFDNPNIDVEMYVNSRAMRAGGMMIAGVPGVLIGQTNKFAFTTTSGEIDNSTLYVETLQEPAAPEPQSVSAQYAVLQGGSFVPLDRRTETFHYAGEVSTKPAAYAPAGPALNDGPLLYNVFRVNDCDPAHFHGYVIEFDLGATPPRAFTYKTAYWKNESSTVDGFLEYGLDQNFTAFQSSVHKVVSLHNFFFADKKGNIAYWSAGARPAFPAGFDDRLPADGTGSQEWGTHPGGERYVPFSKSLLSVNPTQGWLANWNTKPADKPYVQEGNSHDEHWGEVYRSQRIAFLLANDDAMSLEDAEEIERDVGTMDGSTDTIRAAVPALFPFIQQAYMSLLASSDPLVDPTTHPTLQQVMQILFDWNRYLTDTSQIFVGGHYAPGYNPSRGQPGMSIFFQWWYAMKKNLWGGGRPGATYVGTVDFSDSGIDGNDYLGETTYNMLLHVLRGAQSGVPQRYAGDYFGGHRDQMIVQSLNDAIALLSGTGPLPEMGFGTCDGSGGSVSGFGTPDPTAWGWQPPADLDFDCLDSFADPLLATGTMPTGFGKAPSENRSTYMQALELGSPIRGENVLPPGQSGFLQQQGAGIAKADPHMGDQAELFRTFTYKPMQLDFK